MCTAPKQRSAGPDPTPSWLIEPRARREEKVSDSMAVNCWDWRSGGCLCNDLQYVAHDLGVRLLTVEVDVTLQLEGNPTVATAAEVAVRVDVADKMTDVPALINRAVAISTVANSLQRGLAITVSQPQSG
jgi:OsmC-like protein